jgi:hypothetical protein
MNLLPDTKLQFFMTYAVVYFMTQQMIYRVYRGRSEDRREALAVSVMGATMPFAAWGMLLLFTITAPLRKLVRA